MTLTHIWFPNIEEKQSQTTYLCNCAIGYFTSIFVDDKIG